MIIGIDLDNTIIDYRNAFWHTALSTGIYTERHKNSFSNNHDQVPNKNEIKNHLILEEDGSYKWESLQGLVYGKHIHNAAIYPGVSNFLLHCKKTHLEEYKIAQLTPVVILNSIQDLKQ